MGTCLTRPLTMVRGCSSPRSTCSTYSESASGCFFTSTISPMRMSRRDTSTRSGAAGVAAGSSPKINVTGHFIFFSESQKSVQLASLGFGLCSFLLGGLRLSLGDVSRRFRRRSLNRLRFIRACSDRLLLHLLVDVSLDALRQRNLTNCFDRTIHSWTEQSIPIQIARHLHCRPRPARVAPSTAAPPSSASRSPPSDALPPPCRRSALREKTNVKRSFVNKTRAHYVYG